MWQLPIQVPFSDEHILNIYLIFEAPLKRILYRLPVSGHMHHISASKVNCYLFCFNWIHQNTISRYLDYLLLCHRLASRIDNGNILQKHNSLVDPHDTTGSLDLLSCFMMLFTRYIWCKIVLIYSKIVF